MVTPVVECTCTCTSVSVPALLLDAAHQIVRRLRSQKRRHVFDANRLAAQFAQLLGHFHKLFHGVQRRYCVADRAFRVLASSLHCLQGSADVANIVQCVEHSEHVHPVFGRFLHKAIDHRVLVMPVAKQILTPQQHLQPRVWHQLAESSQPLPGIFIEKADARVVGCASPTFDAPKAGAIDVRAGRNHIFQRHSRGHQTLMGISQREFSDFNSFWHDKD